MCREVQQTLLCAPGLNRGSQLSAVCIQYSLTVSQAFVYLSIYLSIYMLHLLKHTVVYCTVWYGVLWVICAACFHPECVLELLLSLIALPAQCGALAVSLLGKAARQPTRVAFGFRVMWSHGSSCVFCGLYTKTIHVLFNCVH